MAITLVGLQSGSWAGATSSQTVSLSLSGGTASLPANDDLVLIGYATGSSTDRTLGITGYTLVGTELYSDDVNDTNLRVSYKFMGATPDTLAIFSGTGNNADAGTWVIQVWRGVDTSSPLDVAAVTATGIDTGRANPGQISPSTAGAIIAVFGAGAATSGAVFTSSDLSNFVSRTQADTYDSFIGAGSYAWVSGKSPRDLAQEKRPSGICLSRSSET